MPPSDIPLPALLPPVAQITKLPGRVCVSGSGKKGLPPTPSGGGGVKSRRSLGGGKRGRESIGGGLVEEKGAKKDKKDKKDKTHKKDKKDKKSKKDRKSMSKGIDSDSD